MTQPARLKAVSHLKHKDKRSREHLYESEVEALIQAAKQGRNPIRNQTLILICYKHGLRPGEACDLRWGDIDFENGEIYVYRVSGLHSVHPLGKREVSLLKRLYKERHNSTYVFTTTHGSVLTAGNFSKIMLNAGVRAGLLMPIHPQQLRHSTCHKLLSEGVDVKTVQRYLGHADRHHTLRYKEKPA